MPRILIFGKNGQLARALADNAANTKNELIFYGHSEFNLLDKANDIKPFIANFNDIDCVINASAFTNVDEAERDEWQAASKLNTIAVSKMAQACRTKDIPFIHISTESVFDGRHRSAYLPTDETRPANFYGLTKYLGEDLTRKIGGRSIVLRTSWVFAGAGQNFVKAILRAAKNNKTISVVNDQIGLPTYAPDLAKAVLTVADKMIAAPNRDYDFIYHIAGGGAPINRYELAKLIIKISGLKTKVKPISSARFNAPAPRPENAVLDTQSFSNDFGIDLPNWQIGLRDMLSKMDT